MIAGIVAGQGIGDTGGIPVSGMIAAYTMDSISGATLNDQTGVFNGTIYGASTVTGAKGNALSFNGSSNYVDLGTSLGAALTGDFTISIWVKNRSTGDAVYFSKYAAVPSFFEIGRATVGACFYVRHANSGGVDVLLKDPDTIASYGSTFVHVVMRREGSDTEIIVNDSIKAAVTSTRDTTGTGYAARIGSRSFTGAEGFADADIDIVRVYDRALSDAEITLLYNEV